MSRRILASTLTVLACSACAASQSDLRRDAIALERDMVARKDPSVLAETVALYRKSHELLRRGGARPPLEQTPTEQLKEAWEPDVARLLLLAPSLKETRDVAELRRRAEGGEARAMYVLGLRYDPGAEYLAEYVPADDPRAIDAKRGVLADAAASASWYRKAAQAKSSLSCRAASRMASLQIRNPRLPSQYGDVLLARLPSKIRSAVEAAIDERTGEGERAEASAVIRAEGLRCAPLLYEALKASEMKSQRALALLQEVSGQDLPAESAPWRAWLDGAP